MDVIKQLEEKLSAARKLTLMVETLEKGIKAVRERNDVSPIVVLPLGEGVNYFLSSCEGVGLGRIDLVAGLERQLAKARNQLQELK